MFAIQKLGTKALMSAIGRLAKNLSKVHDEMHQLAVESLYHAAEHGDVRPLQAFFDTLSTNYKTAFRQYVGRTFTTHPDAAFVVFKGGSFSVVSTEANSNALGLREAFKIVAEKHLINPDGKDYKRFYERDVIQEAILMSDGKVASALKQMIARAKGEKQGDRDVKSDVNPQVVKALEGALQVAETSAAAYH